MARFGILGRRLGHTYSPQIHAELADYSYDVMEVEPEDLASFLQTTDYAGFNVTIPYKKSVIEHCVQLSGTARKLGSVNTLLRRADGWYGDNTDYYGFMYMTRRSGIAITGKRVLVLGSGGASPTICQVLRDLGAAEVTVISRSGPNNYENMNRSADIIANTTPVGMYPRNGETPLDLRTFSNCSGVLDIVYNPSRTKLLQDADELGIPAAGGLSMLVAQAKRAAECFAGCTIDDSEIERITRRMEHQMKNVILIGMPGCGKSAIGQALAQRLDRPFFDADMELEQRLGTTIPEMFRTQGEAAFRAEETNTLAELGMRSGSVIATGGGALMRPGNPALLRQNGQLVWIKRPLDALPVDGRPVSQSTALSELYEKRRPVYAANADLTVENTDTIEAAVDQIEEWLK